MVDTSAYKCKSVEDLLKEVSKQVSEYEALKLNELKSQLEAFVKKKSAATEEYKKKYDDLKTLWEKQGKRIDELRSDFKCAFPDEKWKKLIQEQICPLLADLHEAEAHIKCRSVCPGKKEEQRDRAKADLESAQTTVSAWETAAQRIDTQLKDNQKVIEEIGRLMQGPDRVIGIYLLWFKLMLAHSQLRPSETAVFPEEESPEKLCSKAEGSEEKKERSCECPAWPWEPQTTEEPAPTQSGTAPRIAPWLVAKDNYSETLDCAWADYKAKKEAFASKDTAFKADPDDLATRREKYEDKKKTLDDDVKQALKKANFQSVSE